MFLKDHDHVKTILACLILIYSRFDKVFFLNKNFHSTIKVIFLKN